MNIKPPLKATPTGAIPIVISDATGEELCTIYPSGHHLTLRDREKAMLICKAVGMHEELIKGLEEAVAAEAPESCRGWIDDARALIEKAKE